MSVSNVFTYNVDVQANIHFKQAVKRIKVILRNKQTKYLITTNFISTMWWFLICYFVDQPESSSTPLVKIALDVEMTTLNSDFHLPRILYWFQPLLPFSSISKYSYTICLTWFKIQRYIYLYYSVNAE